MRFVPSKTSWCFSAGPLLHKALEIELGWGENQGFSTGWRLNSRGDHAGFKVWLDLFKLYFTFNVYDHRHWNYAENRWYEPGEEPVFEGYPHE